MVSFFLFPNEQLSKSKPKSKQNILENPNQSRENSNGLNVKHSNEPYQTRFNFDSVSIRFPQVINKKILKYQTLIRKPDWASLVHMSKGKLRDSIKYLPVKGIELIIY